MNIGKIALLALLLGAGASAPALARGAAAAGGGGFVGGPAGPGFGPGGPAGGFGWGGWSGSSHRNSFVLGTDRVHGHPGTSALVRGDIHRPGHGGHGHHGRHWVGWGGWGYGYPYTDAYTIPSADFFGYFSTGGEVSRGNGRASYDYDRGYPYEWYRPPSGASAANADYADHDESGPAEAVSTMHCDTEWVGGGRRGARIAVQVCRGR